MMRPNHYPRDCFASMYEARIQGGIKNGSEYVSFCSVFFCRQGYGVLMTTEDTTQLVM